MWWVHPSLQLYPVISLHTFEGSIRSAVPVGSRTSTLPGVEKNAGDSMVFVTYGNWKGLITDANECRGRWKRFVRYYSVFFKCNGRMVLDLWPFPSFDCIYKIDYVGLHVCHEIASHHLSVVEKAPGRNDRHLNLRPLPIVILRMYCLGRTSLPKSRKCWYIQLC